MINYNINSIWHTTPVGERSPEVINAIIEIPLESRVKYEMDKETGLLKMDRVIYTSMIYPANYGFIPKTFCGDGDPLDILVLCSEKVVPFTLMRARVIGVMQMVDQGEDDDKIIAVAEDDISMAHIHSLDDLPEIKEKQIIRFFEDYKILENKIVKVHPFQGKEVAYKIIQEAFDFYNSSFGSKR